MNLEQHLIRQMVFSRATFGPGERRAGVIDHIRKELHEVEAGNGDPEEWIDVVILALDGLTRALWAKYPAMPADVIAEQAVHLIRQKQAKNERRNWPDWRTADPDKAIEHVRTGDQP
jgi:hypothetical protein